MSKPIDDAPLRSCDYSLVQPQGANFSDALAYYAQIRDYIKHEDGLVNWRMTWSLTVHGFLFGVYGLLLGKIADLFLDVHKNPPISLLIEGVICWMLFLQLILAIFGATIGYRSREAILAAHAAIQHLFTIGRSSPLLGSAPKRTVVKAGIPLGRQTVTPNSMAGIDKDMLLLISPASKEHDRDREEIVQVLSKTDKTFDAIFSKPHGSGTQIQLHAPLLLPKLIGGGDKGATTKPAQFYYTDLPALALRVWIVLGAISAVFFLASIAGLWQSWFRGTWSLQWLYYKY